MSNITRALEVLTRPNRGIGNGCQYLVCRRREETPLSLFLARTAGEGRWRIIGERPLANVVGERGGAGPSGAEGGEVSRGYKTTLVTAKASMDEKDIGLRRLPMNEIRRSLLLALIGFLPACAKNTGPEAPPSAAHAGAVRPDAEGRYASAEAALAALKLDAACAEPTAVPVATCSE